MKPKQTKVGWKKNLDKLLFVFASCYLMIALAWLWRHHQKVSLARDNPSSSSVELNNSNLSSTNTDSNNDPSLSLNNDEQTTKTLENSQKDKLSSHVIDGQEVISLSRENTVIPVPQPLPPPPLPVITIPEPSSSISSNSLVQSPLPVKIPPKPRQQSSPSLVSVNPPSTLTPIPQKLNQVPVIETTNIESEESLISNNLSPNYPTDENINSQQNTLVGIVELENNSIALFNLNNLTERVEVGSEIGVTGWVLVGINGKQAILNRYNQSLYLTVGEKF